MVDLSAGSSSSELSGSSAPQSCPSHLTDLHASNPHSMQPSSHTSLYPTDSAIPGGDDSSSFDRNKFPVKYYLADFSSAIQLPQLPSEHNHDRSSPPMSSPPYLKDVKDLGLFFSNIVDDVGAFLLGSINYCDKMDIDSPTRFQVQIPRIGHGYR